METTRRTIGTNAHNKKNKKQLKNTRNYIKKLPKFAKTLKTSYAKSKVERYNGHHAYKPTATKLNYG